MARSLLTATVAAILIFAATGIASANVSTGSWTDVNSPGSYCGSSDASITNNLGLAQQRAVGDVVVDNGNPCGTGSPVILPANYLKITVTLRCITLDQTQWNAWTGTAFNLANTSSVALQSPLVSYCGGYQGSGYPKAKTTITAGYNIFPSGWQYHTHATAWATMT